MSAPSSRFMVSSDRFLIWIASLIQCLCLLLSSPETIGGGGGRDQPGRFDRLNS